MGLVSAEYRSGLQGSSEQDPGERTMDLGGSQGRAMLVSTSASRPAISSDGFLRSDANVVESGPNIRGHRMATTHGTAYESLSTLRTEQEVLGGKRALSQQRISFQQRIEMTAKPNNNNKQKASKSILYICRACVSVYLVVALFFNC